MNWNIIKKNWKTSAVGIGIAAAAGIRLHTTGEIEYGEVIGALGAIGFLAAKDGDKSHTEK